MTQKVFVTHELPGSRIYELSNYCDLQVWMGPGLLSPEILRERTADCTGMVCLLTDRVDQSLIDNMPALQFVSSISVGLDHIDVEALNRRKIPVGHTPGVLVDATADLAFGLLLTAARRIAEANQYVHDEKWGGSGVWHPSFFLGKDVSGATLGIVGLGAIGQAVARRALAFGMRVLAWNRSECEMPGVECVTLDDVLEQSDYVSLHVALSEATRHLIGVRELAMMKSDAILINTARGDIVDEDALVSALNLKQIGGAALDVFSQEPLGLDSALLDVKNVVLTPHIGSATVRTRHAMVNRAIDNALAALTGQPMPHCANPEVYG